MRENTGLRAILLTIREGPMGLRWVSEETGIPESRLIDFLGNDLLVPNSEALTEEEQKDILGWYYFGG